MKRRLYTVLVGDAFPFWYPAMLADNLEKWGVELICVVDEETEKWVPPPCGNLGYIKIGFASLGFRLPLITYFTRWAFFDKNLFDDDEIIFVDLDTIFLKDPEPIFQWCEDPETHKPLQFLRAWGGGADKNILVLPLTYIDHRTECPGKVFSFLRQWPGPGEDDNGVRAALHELNGYTPEKTEESAVYGFMPSHFMGRYKIHHDFNQRWASLRDRWGDVPFESLISMAFNGKEDVHVVVKNKMAGWEIYEPYIREYI